MGKWYILDCECADSSLPPSAQIPPTNGRPQGQMPWPSNFPQYMHNVQAPLFQQMPPYPGYHFPGMQTASYFPGSNMQWPSNLEDSGHVLDQERDIHRNHRSSYKNKKKLSHGKVLETSEQDGSTEPSDSCSETESDDEYLEHEKKYSSNEQPRRKKHGKKSSRKVVIRNINYITSKRNGENDGNSSEEDSFIDGESLKQQVEEAVESLERRPKSTSRHHKKKGGVRLPGNEDGSNDATDQEMKNVDANNYAVKRGDNWDAFQNLLLRDESSNFVTEANSLEAQQEYFTTENSEVGRTFNLEHEEITKNRTMTSDSFVLRERNIVMEGNSSIGSFEADRNIFPTSRKADGTYEELLFLQRNEESGNHSHTIPSACSTESSINKCQKDGDWFFSTQAGKSSNADESKNLNMFDNVYASSGKFGSFHAENNKKDVLPDDSFMVQVRSLENQSESQLRMDISMVPDIVGATQYEYGTPEVPQDKPEAIAAHEPDDLYMVLDRDSTAEHCLASWTPEMDYENTILSTAANEGHPDGETAGCDDGKLPSNGKGSTGKPNGTPKGKVSSKGGPKLLNGSLGRSKSDIITRSKKPSSRSQASLPKSKFEKVFDQHLGSVGSLTE